MAYRNPRSRAPGVAAERDQRFGVLEARPAYRTAFHQIDCKLEIHRSLGALPQQFSVAMPGVAIANHEQSAGLEYRKINNRSFSHAVEIEIAAVPAHWPGRDGLLQRWSDSDTADGRPCRKLELYTGTERAGRADHSALQVQAPAQRIATAGLQPFLAAIGREQVLNRLRSKRVGEIRMPFQPQSLLSRTRSSRTAI